MNSRMLASRRSVMSLYCYCLSDTEHGWAHGSNTVYSVIHRLTGTRIELQPCLGMSWYDLDLNVAGVYDQSTDIHDQARFVTV